MSWRNHHLTQKAKHVLMWYAVILIAATAVAWYLFVFRTRIISTEFIGQVQNIQGDTITAKGLFKSPAHPETLAADQMKVVRITVGSQTKITRTEVMLPTAAELAKTNGYFDGATLPRTNTTVPLTMLVSDKTHMTLTLDVTTQGNIYHDSQFTAQVIQYNVPVYPPAPTPAPSAKK